MSVDAYALRSKFQHTWGCLPDGIVRAPGRVNLIGEHTDYNDGFVLPIAIDRCTLAAWARRSDRTVRLTSAQAEHSATIDLDAAIKPGRPAWANYCRGVIAGLLDAGAPLGATDILFDGDVPLGGGLSSSASLEVATALALLVAADASVPDRQLALLCQEAEHEYAGAPCGIMDQSVVIMGQAGHALLLDCRSGRTRQIPFDDPDKVVLVVDTQVKHDIADGGYAARREQCHLAAEKLGAKALRDIDPVTIERAAANGVLTGTELRRARHVVGEIQRTLDAVEALEAHDYAAFGELMYASHASLRDDYEVSCKELDYLVNLALMKGALGAKMTGGGLGGNMIALTPGEILQDKVARAMELEGFEVLRTKIGIRT